MKMSKLGGTEKARLGSGKSAASGKPTWAQVPSKKLNIGSAFTPSNPKAKSFDKVKKINTKSPKKEGNAASKVGDKKLKKTKEESESDEDESDSEYQGGESSDEEAPNLVPEKKRKTVEPQKSGKKFKKDDEDEGSDDMDDDEDSNDSDDEDSNDSDDDDDSNESDDDDNGSDELDDDQSDDDESDDSDDDGSGDEISAEETVKEHKNKSKAPEQKKKKDKTELSKKEKLEKKIKERGLKDVSLLNEVRSRIEERIDRTVFVKGKLQKKLASDLKSLVPGIIHARKKFPKAGYALLEFKTVKAAQKGIKLLKDLQVEGQGLIVDKAGQRNKGTTPQGERQIKADPRKLFIPNLPESTTREDVKAVFPKAASVKLTCKGRSNSVHIKFSREEDAQEAFSQKDFKINGQAVTVLFAIMTLSRNKKGKRSGKKARKATKKEGVEEIGKESETGSKKKQNGDLVQKKVKNIKPENIGLIKSPKRKVKQETVESKPAIKKSKNKIK